MLISNWSKLLVLVLLSIAAAAPPGARAQGNPLEQILETRKKVLEQRLQGSTAVAYPQMSTDFMASLQLLGIRPGMTLTQAKAAAAKWGAFVKGLGPPDLQLAQQYLTRDSANAAGGKNYFEFATNAAPDYRGAPAVHIPGKERSAMPGVVAFKVYPLEPYGDIQDPDKLIVYYVATGLQSAAAGQIGEAEFLRRATPLVSGKLIPKISRLEDIKLCEFAGSRATRLLNYSQSVDRSSGNHPDTWPQCGDTTVVQYFKDVNGLIRGYNTERFDMTLARKAFAAFRQYGTEYRAAIYRARGSGSD